MFKIAVVGDVTIDLLKKPGKTVQLTKDYKKNNWELYFGDSQKLRGGALLLAEMIERSFEDDIVKSEEGEEEKEEEKTLKSEKQKSKPNEIDVFTYNETEIDKKSKNYLHTIITLKKFGSSTEEVNCSDIKKKYRINYFDGFSFPKDDNKTKNIFEPSEIELGILKDEEIEKDKKKVFEKKWNPISKEEIVDIKLIHDHGNYFRHIDDEKELKSPLKDNANEETIFIHKMRFPLAKGNLWNSIEKIKKETEKENTENVMKNYIVVINADDLRENGLRISKSLSWERTAFDLRKNIEDIRKNSEKNETLHKLFSLNNLYLIIRFETDGTILYKNSDENFEYNLFFDPYVFEGSNDQKYHGNMKGLGIAFVAGLVLGIQKHHKKSLDDGIEDGIKKGLVASRKLYEIGFKQENDEENNNIDYPFKDMFKIKNEDLEKIIKIRIVDDINWNILEQTLKSDEGKIYDVASQIVRNGSSPDLKSPIAVFGNLQTADKSEIESFHSIKNLINEYLNKGNVSKPLSIAVFGPPGSGKSFGVTQIAKSISDDIKKLEFNLSQFESPKDLFNAFHMVQSTSLKGKIPLVFFDEFDSKLNKEKFGWLKYFLSPMNDGKFKQGDNIHPIGKCIFVFAGGTKKTFEEFNEDKTKAKGSDFVSRLRGFVNVMGINKSDEEFIPYKKYIPDNSYMIRRAMVLRSILEKNSPTIFEESNGKKIAQIDDSVLNALIKVPKYKHGNRSLEAIIEMSVLSDRKRFSRSALPSSEQLQLHVDKDKFKEYLNE